MVLNKWHMSFLKAFKTVSKEVVLRGTIILESFAV